MSCNEKTQLLAAKRQHIIIMPKTKDYEDIDGSADYYAGSLSLEQLLPYTVDPWWQTVRRLCFGCLWLTFVLTLATAWLLAYLHDAHGCHTSSSSRVITAATEASTLPLALTANGTLLLSI